jgi:hypothetical protein
MHPWPPPARETFAVDPRIAQVEKHLAGVERLIPGFPSIHRMGASLPQECVAITAAEFASILFATTHRVPAYQTWLESIDHRPRLRGAPALAAVPPVARSGRTLGAEVARPPGTRCAFATGATPSPRPRRYRPQPRG